MSVTEVREEWGVRRADLKIAMVTSCLDRERAEHAASVLRALRIEPVIVRRTVTTTGWTEVPTEEEQDR